MTRINLTDRYREVSDAMLETHAKTSPAAASIVSLAREQRAKIVELTNEREAALRDMRNLQREFDKLKQERALDRVRWPT